MALDLAPCGCRFGSVDGVFIYKPCSPTCRLYAYAVEGARKQGMPITEFDSRGISSVLPDVRRCPYCGVENDSHAGTTRRDVPEPGDLSLCYSCSRPAIFTESGLRKPTSDERAGIDADEQVQAAIKAAKAMRRGGVLPG